MIMNKKLRENHELNCSLIKQMSTWPEFTRYSKKSFFLSNPEDAEVLAWADQVIHRLGGIKGTNDGEEGWILPKSQEMNLLIQYRVFRDKTDALNQRARQSRNPEKKRKRSRVFVRAPEHSIFSGAKRTNSEDIHSENEDSSKPISYINWEKVDDKQSGVHSEDEKKHSSRKSEDDDEKIESDEEPEECESSDDEMIQEVLARKMKSESSGKLIETETVNDSDEEDCVSYSRRLRHVYVVIENLRSRVKELEAKLNLSSTAPVDDPHT